MNTSASHGHDNDHGHSTGDSHTYSRRTLLATVTVTGGSASVAAGCLADEESAGERSAGGNGSDGGNDNERADNPTNDDGLAFFEDYLESEGVNVTERTVDGTTVELTYATDRTTDQELGDEIGTITGGYVLAGDHGLETGRLNATITDGEQALATWHIRETWVKEFEGGELSPDELTTNVLNTVELVEDA